MLFTYGLCFPKILFEYNIKSRLWDLTFIIYSFIFALSCMEKQGVKSEEQM